MHEKHHQQLVSAQKERDSDPENYPPLPEEVNRRVAELLEAEPAQEWNVFPLPLGVALEVTQVSPYFHAVLEVEGGDEPYSGCINTGGALEVKDMVSHEQATRWLEEAIERFRLLRGS